MKRIFSLLLAALLMTGALAGCNSDTPADTADPADTAETTPAETTPAETEPPVEEKLPYKEPVVAEFDGYTVTLEAPVVVFQGEEGDDAWGHTNFPSVGRTAEGYLRVSWMYGEDKVGGSGTTYAKISMNEGKSWLPIGSYGSAPSTKMMPNGKCFSSFISTGYPKSNDLAAATKPFMDLGTGQSIYFAEDLADNGIAKELGLLDLSFKEYDPETKTYETVECTLNWPHAGVLLHHPNNLFGSISQQFGLSGANVIVAADGTLYTCIYTRGFDSTAATREEAVNDYIKTGCFCVYVFESPDSGRTWNFLAQLTPGEEVEDMNAPGFEGYCEPKMIEMPDGSFVMLLRSGGMTSGTCPIYITRSEDNCRTWTTPEVFDYCGVLPQLLQLDCGVTVASYGRPDLFIRTTNDPSGAEWDEHIEIPLASTSRQHTSVSCFYTGMMKLDDTSAWLVYTDFKYPNRKGVPVKSVILRKIVVTPTEN